MMRINAKFLNSTLDARILILIAAIAITAIISGCGGEGGPQISDITLSVDNAEPMSNESFTLTISGECTGNCENIEYAGFGRVALKIGKSWAGSFNTEELVQISPGLIDHGLSADNDYKIYAFQTARRLSAEDGEISFSLTIHPYFPDGFYEANKEYIIEGRFTTTSAPEIEEGDSVTVIVRNAEPDASEAACQSPFAWDATIAPNENKCCGDDDDDCGHYQENLICLNHEYPSVLEGTWKYAKLSDFSPPPNHYVVQSKCGNYPLLADTGGWYGCQNPEINRNCIVSLSDDQNAHIGECGEYNYSIVCKSPKGAGLQFKCSIEEGITCTNGDRLFGVSNTTNAHFGNDYSVCCEGIDGVDFFGEADINNQMPLFYISNSDYMNAHASPYADIYTTPIMIYPRIPLICNVVESHPPKTLPVIVTTDPTDPKIKLSDVDNEFLCNYEQGITYITECCGENINSCHNFGGTYGGPKSIAKSEDTRETIVNGKNVVMTCTDEGTWVYGLNDIDITKCTEAGGKWIGTGPSAGLGRCCGDDTAAGDFDDYFSYPIPDYETGEYASNLNAGSACWGLDAKPVPANTTTDDKNALNLNGTLYGCNLTHRELTADIQQYDINNDGLFDAKDIQIAINNYLHSKVISNSYKSTDFDGDGKTLEGDVAEIHAALGFWPGDLYETLPGLYTQELELREPDSFVPLFNANTNIGTCARLDSWYCEYENTWKEFNPDDFGGDTDWNTDLQISEGITGVNTPSGNKFKGCCPDNYCWDQTSNTCVAGDGSEEIVPVEGHVCIMGVWKAEEEVARYDWDWDIGFCPNDDECVAVSPGGIAATFCVADGTYIADHVCENGNWSTRTSKIANELLKYASDADSYTLYCGKTAELLPYIGTGHTVPGFNEVSLIQYITGEKQGDADLCVSDELQSNPTVSQTPGFFVSMPNGYKGVVENPGCINNICVLRTNASGTEKVFFGFSYNNYTGLIQPGLTASSYFTNIVGLIDDIDDQQILIYNLGTGQAGSPPSITAFISNIISWIYNLFFGTLPPSVEVPSNSEQIYISESKEAEKTIYGVIDSGNYTEPTKRMAIEFTGYNQDISKALVNYIGPAYEIKYKRDGNKQAIYSNSERGIAKWPEFTARIRPEMANS